jgi:hypothetical protein
MTALGLGIPWRRAGRLRDQLQDAVDLMWVEPRLARRQILLHAAQQFMEGDVLHWFHVLEDGRTGFAARTHASDTLFWLPWAVAKQHRRDGQDAQAHEYRRAAYRLWRKISPLAHVGPGEIETYGGQPNQQAADMLTTYEPGRMIWNGSTPPPAISNELFTRLPAGGGQPAEVSVPLPGTPGLRGIKEVVMTLEPRGPLDLSITWLAFTPNVDRAAKK